MTRSPADAARGHETIATPLRVASLRWERIQLTVELQPPPDAEVAPHTGQFRLLGIDAPSPMRMTPTNDSIVDGRRRLRFNVMAGPGQVPLSPGRWILQGRFDAAGAPWSGVTVAEELIDDLGSASRDFAVGAGSYSVRLELTGEPLTLTLRVSRHLAHTPRASRIRRFARSWRLRATRRVRVGLFQTLVSALRRLVPRTGRAIVFTSDSREALGGNLRIVHDRMVERGLDRSHRLRSIFKPSVRARRSFADRFRLAWLLASADVILVDDYQPAIYRLEPSPRVRIIQLWHAWGAFKTVGYSRIGKPGGTSPYSSVHKNYSYATVSSPYVVPFYAEAFGIPESRVIPTGVPRMDEFLDPERQRVGREAALAAFPAARDRHIILFAPTFRGHGARQARYPMDIIDLEALHELCVERDAIVLFKMHPFVRRRIEIPEPLGDRLIDASRSLVDVNDLLLISDLLITDYSSIVFEYSTLGRPMLFFAHDLDAYVASRDFYEPYESFVPGRIVRSFPELLDAIRRDDYAQEKVAPFADRHLGPRDRSATDRIIDELILPQ